MADLILNPEEQALLVNNVDYASLGKAFRQFVEINKERFDSDTLYAIVAAGVNVACYAAYMREIEKMTTIAISFDDMDNDCIITVDQITVLQ